MLSNAYIPYKGYYSTPFVRWQGSLANENSITLGAETSRRWLQSKDIDPKIFDYLILGVTVGQPAIFYGGPWASALIGATDTAGLYISQACSTSTTGIFQAALGVEGGAYHTVYTLFTDRCSNGPHTIWPNPNGPGGQVISENWVMDHFGNDPWGCSSMIQTAENVIKMAGITRAECDAHALRRYEQYTDSLADDRAFQKRYMFPVEVKVSKKKIAVIDTDEGIMPTTAEGLAALKPVLPGGQLTFGTQTHPADGHCALIVTDRERARQLSQDENIEIQVISFGHARVKKAHMPMAPVPAAVMALERAGLTIDDIKVIKTHNPFAANDIYMSKQLNIDINSFNNYGCSMIFGHPQAPTAGRSIIEGIEEAAMLGGGYVLFTGCAAGDTSASLILKVG
ncbi:thiolase family protein [Desulfococcus multivorans]|jgi:acetyl-CoA acetyltransferase|uniref:Thiolase domain-containing protein n=1 Tax=Desulfococcus multivorans DSM 2059 TaxID=1121405 RepID=S7UKD4_DESML|nr:thiolase family protein [Desulfococcus multivorans]AOY59237.1 thiolase [Desulfococcus multivorans]AQV01460.1 acetyl-CoA acetyltransferase [Desulfococcus multivorans]EPR32743.1 Thiolase domain-containing protein [Desulfococcus multivorans DSM 2059]SKA26475.1 Acetyl-CoA acetyltransferase [Desulfococcus multivorans DSM 2059]